jgi:hypothetical protein
VNLSRAHRDAILQLGNTASSHDFIATEVLEQMLALGLVYWRATDNLDFTPVGERVFKELDAE